MLWRHSTIRDFTGCCEGGSRYGNRKLSEALQDVLNVAPGTEIGMFVHNRSSFQGLFCNKQSVQDNARTDSTCHAYRSASSYSTTFSTIEGWLQGWTKWRRSNTALIYIQTSDITTHQYAVPHLFCAPFHFRTVEKTNRILVVENQRYWMISGATLRIHRIVLHFVEPQSTWAVPSVDFHLAEPPCSPSTRNKTAVLLFPKLNKNCFGYFDPEKFKEMKIYHYQVDAMMVCTKYRCPQPRLLYEASYIIWQRLQCSVIVQMLIGYTVAEVTFWRCLL